MRTNNFRTFIVIKKAPFKRGFFLIPITVVLLLLGHSAAGSVHIHEANNNCTATSFDGPPIQGKFKKLKIKFKNWIHLKIRPNQKNEKLTSVGLALTLGAFGVHRLYLGTAEHVPIVYAVTLGGGIYILPLIDMAHIIFSKDLERYKKNPHVFMWVEKNE